MVPAVNVSPMNGVRRRVITAAALLVCAGSLLGSAVALAATAAPAATLRDPANDVRAGDIDLTSISVSKRNGALVVRFTVRRPITDNVSYTASVRSGAGSWALVARRSGGADSFVLYNLSTGQTTTISGQIAGRTATVRAPIAALGGQTNADAGPAQCVLPSRAGRRPERRRRPCRHDRADDLVLPHGSSPEAEVGSLHLARPGPLSGAANAWSASRL